ncbi:MAG TPA: MotA/TolQ/ExbB proton channel family protein [Pseudomonadales bacterium]
MHSWLADIARLAAQGGEVIWLLFAASLLLWLLIAERYSYVYRVYPACQRRVLAEWQARADRQSWYAEKIRETLLSQQRAALTARLSSIRMLIAICPLLGLLGTVTGMVSVFDTIAITGTSDARAMASGIYRATLPTMAGLMLALSGLYFSHHLQQKAQRLADTLADRLANGLTKGATP